MSTRDRRWEIKVCWGREPGTTGLGAGSLITAVNVRTVGTLPPSANNTGTSSLRRWYHTFLGASHVTSDLFGGRASLGGYTYPTAL